jgi:hypothetical protein
MRTDENNENRREQFVFGDHCVRRDCVRNHGVCRAGRRVGAVFTETGNGRYTRLAVNCEHSSLHLNRDETRDVHLDLHWVDERCSAL